MVETHIETAAPVGSCMLRDRYHMDYSPATLRHEMGVLEEVGYLVQPHTSSGRIPTDRGYRYYVDNAVETSPAVSEGISGLEGDLLGFSKENSETEPLLEEASRLLALLAQEASLVILPNTQLGGGNRVKLYLQGSSHILEKPEFQDVSKVRNLFRVFEEKARLAEWISAPSEDHEVTVRIGQENEPQALHDCSVISAQYDLPGQVSGTIAIVGPKRMRYSQTIPLVFRMAGLMNQILDERSSG